MNTSIKKPINKIDGMALVTGKPVYTEDKIFHKDVLTVKILRSPHPFAKIIDIDVSAALKIDGVEAIFTYKDVPKDRFTTAAESFPETSLHDRLILEDIVRYVGDEVAIIAAKDEKTAEKAKELIKVDYEVYKPVLDFEKAYDNPSIIHPEDDIKIYLDFGTNTKKNLVAEYNMKKNDFEPAYADSEVKVEKTYYTQAQSHGMMETHRAYTYFDEMGQIVVIAAIQSPFNTRRLIAKAIGRPLTSVRVIKPRVGGAFGGKNSTLPEIYCAFVTMKTKKPAKIVYERKETFGCTTSRHGMRITVKVGSDKEGNIKALEMDCLLDTGAYGEHGAGVAIVAGGNVLPLYNRVPAINFKGKAVYTNKVPAGALRGFGATQGCFAVESAINELAAKLNMDPTEIRFKNIVHVGDTGGFIKGSVDSCLLDKCIETGKKLINWDEKFPYKQVNTNKIRSVGMAVGMHGSGIAAVDTASATIRLQEDGTYIINTGSADIGTGADTALIQIAAETMFTTVDKVKILAGDTATCPFDAGAFASSTVYVTGNAVLKAAEALREEMIKEASRILEIKEETVVFDGNMLYEKDNKDNYLTVAKLGELSVVGHEYKQLSASRSFGSPNSPIPFVAGFVEVEIDIETGKLDVIEFVGVVDCGTRINPNLTRIQAEGGFVMGIGLAMYENVFYDNHGKLATNTFMQYKIPSRKDIGKIVAAFEESHEPSGPYGAKSIGEVVIHTPSPAIANAVYNAVGVHIRSLPITPEKIFKAIKLKNKNLVDVIK